MMKTAAAIIVTQIVVPGCRARLAMTVGDQGLTSPSPTLGWRDSFRRSLGHFDSTGVLHERSLTLQGLLATLPGLRARATVVAETGIVCGGVRERIDHRTQR
jgi:hypothetical protein